MSRKTRKRRSKAHAQQVHAIRRAWQRFEVELTEGDLNHLVRQIQGGSEFAHYIDSTSNRIGRFVVELPGEIKAIACYDRRRKTITTFLPLDWVPGGGELP